MSYYNNIRACSHPPLSPTIQRCCEARNKAMAACKEAEIERLFQVEYNRNRKRAEIEAIVDKEKVQQAGAHAYTGNIPGLASRQDVLDFIACVAHGMTVGAIDPADGPKMLYAAQVALSGYGKLQPSNGQAAA